MNQQNQIALVTGASRGIGAAIAAHLGKQGACVLGTATTEKGAAEITERLQKEKIKGKGVVLNVTDIDKIKAVIDHIAEEYAAPLILVNNAGVTRDNLFMRMKDEEWNTVVETNLNALYHMTKYCLRPMLKARWGRIINISSIVGSIGNPGQTNYAAAKAGMIGFSKSLAYEVASRGITVNVVSPGFIKTDMTNNLPENQKQLLLTRIPMQRLGEPSDVAKVVAFLTTADADYITGQTIHVNGGMYMN